MSKEVNERFFISPLNVTPRISMTVLEDEFLQVGDRKYIEISKKPRGKNIVRTLLTMDENERITIYR